MVDPIFMIRRGRGWEAGFASENGPFAPTPFQRGTARPLRPNCYRELRPGHLARRANKPYRHAMARIAFLGLGVMGAPMARHLAAAGHALIVYNRSPRKGGGLGRAAWRRRGRDGRRSRRRARTR